MVKKQKTKVMTAKFCKNKKRINLSSRKKRSYKSNTRDNTNLA